MRPNCGLSLALSTTWSCVPVQIRGHRPTAHSNATHDPHHKIPEERKPEPESHKNQPKVKSYSSTRTKLPSPPPSRPSFQRPTAALAEKKSQYPATDHVMMGKCILSHTHPLAPYTSIDRWTRCLSRCVSLSAELAQSRTVQYETKYD